MKLFIAFAFLMIAATVALGQKGTAEPDYYPMNYGGDTWTGDVTAIDNDTRAFTLTYKKGDKEQSFVGVLTKGYTVKMKDGKDYELKMSDLVGMRVKVYYLTKSTKDANGLKVKTYEVFKLRFLPKD